VSDPDSAEPPPLTIAAKPSSLHQQVLAETVSSSVPLPPPPPAPPGTARAAGELIGRFLVVDQLGEGGMGVVYKAYDPELGRLIAIKRLRTQDPRIAEPARLVREAQAVAQVKHPNVVAVYDVGEVGSDVFIAMEYVDGWRLREWLSATKRSLREILDVFAQAAEGLAAAHDAGLVHRDFKPQNVLVGYDGRVRVVDFGLARPIAGEPEFRETTSGQLAPLPENALELDRALTPAGVALGTPRYMAPEQHMGKSLDGRTDQFAFCVALYEAVVGATPFPAKNLAELAAKVIRGVPKPIPRDADVPKWLRKLLLRGLSLDPDERYASMQDVLDELRQDHAALRRAALGTEQHTEHMLAAFPPPEDEATAGRVRELQRRLERARGRKERGLVREALAGVEELASDLGELDYLPLRAATFYLLGELRHKTGDHAGARAALDDALRAAATAGDDWQLAAAWVLMLSVVGVGLGRADEAETLAQAAEVACLRVGNNPSLRSRLCTARGLVRLAAGRKARDAAGGGAEARDAAGRAEARDAADWFERAVGIDEATYGPRHWFTAVSLLHLSEAWLEAGETGKARPALERAAGICQPEQAAASPTRARCILLLGRIAEADGDRDEAQRRFAAAAGAFERCPGHEGKADEARRRAAGAAGAEAIRR
jgi:predicted Ser/Thr protein kinase/tetratricopeptide (TPR) repeat protein